MCRSPPALKGFPSQNAGELNPLAFHSVTRLAHVSSSAMPNSLRRPPHAEQTVSMQRIRRFIPACAGNGRAGP